MLINLHGHQLTRAMFEQDDHWGPFWDQGALRIGDWVLGTKRQEAPTIDEDLAARWTPEIRLEAMDKAGVDRLVISLPSHMGLYHAEPAVNIAYAEAVNEDMAKYCAHNPDRFSFWAHAPLQDPSAAARELERAVKQLGAKGLGMGASNFGGLEVYMEAMYPIWEKACELDVPLFVHGYNQSVTWGENAQDDPFDTTSIVGMLYDESKLFWFFVNGGVLDVFPDLHVYITHGGGYVPYQLGRFTETNLTMCPDSKNKKHADDYRDNFYFDPLLHHPSMRRAVVDVIGVDHLLYGDNFGGADSVDFDLTEGIGLSDADREKIRSGNAKKLLRF
jgi:aminocarboxymuconate-semialdehyde decarboxylase